ncbi:hypothetical protein BDI4_80014 [Burkholderia diffusa]|nr:hypothetical protein BDI4_80014 [Burkholderia diffusa]
MSTELPLSRIEDSLSARRLPGDRSERNIRNGYISFN